MNNQLFVGEWLTNVKENLIFDAKDILYWFRLNSSKANPGKFQFRILRDKSYQKHILKVNSIKVEASDDFYCLELQLTKN